MSQKIVIKTSVSKQPSEPSAVTYQWHWKRIFMATAAFAGIATVGVYGVVDNVNADEDDVQVTVPMHATIAKTDTSLNDSPALVDSNEELEGESADVSPDTALATPELTPDRKSVV